MNPNQPQETITGEVQSEESIKITRRSGWSMIFVVLGAIGLIIAGVGFIFYLKADYNNEKSAAISYMIMGVLGATQFFFLSFLINVLTDIRWFLRPMVKMEETASDPDADIKRRCNEK